MGTEMQNFDIFTLTVLLFRCLNTVMSGLRNYAANSHNVYSNVYTNKKTNQSDITPSGWLSTVGPAGLEPRLAVEKCSGGAF